MRCIMHIIRYISPLIFTNFSWLHNSPKSCPTGEVIFFRIISEGCTLHGGGGRFIYGGLSFFKPSFVRIRFPAWFSNSPYCIPSSDPRRKVVWMNDMRHRCDPDQAAQHQRAPAHRRPEEIHRYLRLFVGTVHLCAFPQTEIFFPLPKFFPSIVPKLIYSEAQELIPLAWLKYGGSGLMQISHLLK